MTTIILDANAVRALIKDDDLLAVDLKMKAAHQVAEAFKKKLVPELIRQHLDNDFNYALHGGYRNEIAEQVKKDVQMIAQTAVDVAVKQIIITVIETQVRETVERLLEGIAQRIIDANLTARIDRHIQARVASLIGRS